MFLSEAKYRKLRFLNHKHITRSDFNHEIYNTDMSKLDQCVPRTYVKIASYIYAFEDEYIYKPTFADI